MTTLEAVGNKLILIYLFQQDGVNVGHVRRQ